MATLTDPFRECDGSPDATRLVMMYVKYPLSLPKAEDLLAERRIDACHEAVRFWSNRFGQMSAAEAGSLDTSRNCQHSLS